MVLTTNFISIIISNITMNINNISKIAYIITNIRGFTSNIIVNIFKILLMNIITSNDLLLLLPKVIFSNKIKSILESNDYEVIISKLESNNNYFFSLLTNALVYTKEIKNNANVNSISSLEETTINIKHYIISNYYNNISKKYYAEIDMNKYFYSLLVELLEENRSININDYSILLHNINPNIIDLFNSIDSILFYSIYYKIEYYSKITINFKIEFYNLEKYNIYSLKVTIIENQENIDSNINNTNHIEEHEFKSNQIKVIHTKFINNNNNNKLNKHKNTNTNIDMTFSFLSNTNNQWFNFKSVSINIDN